MFFFLVCFSPFPAVFWVHGQMPTFFHLFYIYLYFLTFIEIREKKWAKWAEAFLSFKKSNNNWIICVNLLPTFVFESGHLPTFSGHLPTFILKIYAILKTKVGTARFLPINVGTILHVLTRPVDRFLSVKPPARIPLGQLLKVLFQNILQ